MKSGVNVCVELVTPKALFIGVRTSMAALACVALLCVSGCESLWTEGMLKTDLNAFLDGDGTEEIEEVVDDADVFPPMQGGVEKMLLEPEIPLERCAPEVDTKFSYKRRVAILAFDIHHRRDTADFPHIERQYPKLLRGYVDEDRLIVAAATNFRLLNNMDSRNGAWVESERRQIMNLAENLNVQFIVTGSVEDMSIVNPDVNAVNFTLDHMARKKWMGKVKRNLAVTLNIYDGGTGMLIKRQTFADDTYVDSRMLQKKKSLSKAFLRSQYGELMTGMLKQQGDFFLSSVDCIPLQAKVIAVDKSGVTFSAGIESMILSGDKFQVFRRVKIDWSDNSNENYRLEKYGQLTISRSNPLSAYGLFEDKDMSSGVNPGDIVQAW